MIRNHNATWNYKPKDFMKMKLMNTGLFIGFKFTVFSAIVLYLENLE